jgi:hypothetical protein
MYIPCTLDPFPNVYLHSMYLTSRSHVCIRAPCTVERRAPALHAGDRVALPWGHLCKIRYGNSNKLWWGSAGRVDILADAE